MAQPPKVYPVAQVMYDKAIMFEGSIYTVTQTWNGPQIAVSVSPANQELEDLIKDLVAKHRQITLRDCGGYFEIQQPNS